MKEGMMTPHTLLLTWLPLLLSVFVCREPVSAQELTFSITQKGDYTITRRDGTVWLRSAPTFFIVNNVTYSAADSSLTLQSLNTSSDQGYVIHTLTYLANDTRIVAAVHDYTPYDFFRFTVTFPDGANDTKAASPDEVICGFPGFLVDPAPARFAYMSYGLSTLQAAIGRWENGSTVVYDGREGSGPLVLFDRHNRALAVGPASSFTLTSLWHDFSRAFVYWGIMGGVKQLPAGFEYGVAVNDGRQGVGLAVKVWGMLVKGNVFRDNVFRDGPILDDDFGTHAVADSVLDTLGYWTGPGSAYYAGPENGKTYQTTLVDVRQDSSNSTEREPRVDYMHVEIDDWWYEKGEGGGVKTWTAPSSVFPDGVRGMADKTQWMVAASCSVWAPDNTYDKHNDGKYNFLKGDNCSLPQDQAFWDSLFNSSMENHVRAFVQKDMARQYLCMTSGESDVNTVMTWLSQLNVSAAQHQVEVLYGSTLPRLVTEAAVHHTVSPTVQVSEGLVTPDNLWKVGVANIFVSALQLRPFLGVTRSDGNVSEPALSPALYSLLSTVTGGPVAIGDEVGKSDRLLIERCCSASGRVLGPTFPAIPIDDRLQQKAWGGEVGVTGGEVWTTSTSTFLNSDKDRNVHNGIILSTVLSKPYSITPFSAGFIFPQSGTEKNYPPSKLFSALDPYILHDFSDQKPFTLSNCTGQDYCLYHVAPVLTLQGKEVVVLGELSKWVPMSPQRVARVEIGERMLVHTVGEPQEKVYMWFHVDGRLVSLEHRIGLDGTGIVEYALPSSSAPSDVFADHIIVLCACVCVWVRMLV